MKKIVIISALAMMASFVHGQRKQFVDSVDVAGITGTDTTIYFGYTKKLFGTEWSVEIEYSTLDDNDGTISFGVSNNTSPGKSYNTFVVPGDGAFPYTLDATTDAYTNNAGESVATQIWEFPEMKYKWLAVKVTKGSCTSGKIYIYFLQI